MKPITKLYVQTFLLTGIPFGLIMLGFDLAEGLEVRWWKYVLLTVFWGIFMSLTLVTLHRYRLKKNGVQEITKDNLGVYQSRKLQAELNKSELINKLKADPVIGKMKMTQIENGVLLKSSISWKSWGEEIKILLKSENEKDFEFQISSSPRLKTTIVDYGKNLENINRIESLINTMA